MADPVTGLREAGSDRHPLRDALLGLHALLMPMRMKVGDAPAGPAADDPLVDVFLGVLAVAWRLEGILLAVQAAAPPAPPPAIRVRDEGLLR